MMAYQHRVLILDDEIELRENLIDLFTDADCSAHAVSRGTEALQAISFEKYSLAIVDMRLPDMDGSTFIAKASPIQPDLKYIIHTGSLDYVELTKEKIINPEILEIVYKPVVDMQIFLNVLDRIQQ